MYVITIIKTTCSFQEAFHICILVVTLYTTC